MKAVAVFPASKQISIVDHEPPSIAFPTQAKLRAIGVLVEPLTIAEKALIQLAQIQRRLPWASAHKHRAVALGAGPVGLLGAMALVTAGFETYVYSRSSQPLGPLVESFGAKY